MAETYNQVMMPAPRPFRVTRLAIRDRAEMAEILRLADAALQVQRESDRDAAMSVAFDVLVAFEPTLEPARDVLGEAASWGAAFHRVESGELADFAPLRRGEPGFIDLTIWNALAWAAIEISCRLQSDICALGDYFVKAGYFLAHHGPAGEVPLKKELAAWILDEEKASPDSRFTAWVEGQLIATFWLDIDGVLHGRKATPLRSANSAEGLYEDLVVDIAWDDISEGLGRGRPRQTGHLNKLAPIVIEPPIRNLHPASPAVKETIAIDLAAPEVRNSEVPRETSQSEVDRAQGQHVPTPRHPSTPAGWYYDPRRQFAFRWWDGARWTDIVSVDGIPTQDAL